MIRHQIRLALSHAGFKRYFANVSWISLNRLIRLGVGFFVGVWVARYLGPSQFGVLSFGIAWVGLFSVLSQLGLEGIVVRDVVADPSGARATLGTATVLRILGGTVSVFAAIGVYAAAYGTTNTQQLAVIAVLAAAQVFLAADVIDYWFRSRVEWKYVFRARISAFALSTGVKVGMLLVGASVIWIAAVTVLEASLAAGFLFASLRRHKAHLGRWEARIRTAKRLLRDSWPAIFTGIAVVIYMRIDQIMIGSILTEADVGVYSVAVRLSEVWYMIPVAVTQTVMPGIVAARKVGDGSYERRIVWLIAFLFWASVAAAVLMTFIAVPLVHWVFGEAYAAAGRVLQIHFWAGLFVAVGVAISQWYLAENLLKINLYRTLAGAVVNLILNILLIPTLGIVGAAVATVISYFVSAYLSAWWFPQGRTAWRLLNRGIFYPLRGRGRV